MSQIDFYVEASKSQFYYFKIALDWVPSLIEKDEIKTNIREAMASLGVPGEQVGVNVLTSKVVTEAMVLAREKPEISSKKKYLILLMIRSESGAPVQNSAEIAQEGIQEFAMFAGVKTDKVAAVVLENAYIEVEIRRKPVIYPFHPGKVARSKWI